MVNTITQSSEYIQPNVYAGNLNYVNHNIDNINVSQNQIFKNTMYTQI